MCSVYCANLLMCPERHTLSLFFFFRAKLEIQVRNLQHSTTHQTSSILAHSISSSSSVVSFLSGCQCEAAAPKTSYQILACFPGTVSVKKTTPWQKKKDQL